MQTPSPEIQSKNKSPLRITLYILFSIVIIVVVIFIIVNRESIFKRPLTQEEKGEIFQKIQENPPVSDLTQEQKDEIFQKIQENPPVSDLTQEQKKELLKKIQNN